MLKQFIIIHEMLLPMKDDLLSYVADYKLNLIVPNEITDFQKFRSSLGAVLAVIKASKDEGEMERLIENNPVYMDLEREAITTIEMFAGVKINMEQEEEEMDMCKAWYDRRQHGIEDGEKLKLISQVTRKIKKGLSVKEINDFLEEDISLIQKIYDAVSANEDAEPNEILKIIKAERAIIRYLTN